MEDVRYRSQPPCGPGVDVSLDRWNILASFLRHEIAELLVERSDSGWSCGKGTVSVALWALDTRRGAYRFLAVAGPADRVQVGSGSADLFRFVEGAAGHLDLVDTRGDVLHVGPLAESTRTRGLFDDRRMGFDDHVFVAVLADRPSRLIAFVGVELPEDGWKEVVGRVEEAVGAWVPEVGEVSSEWLEDEFEPSRPARHRFGALGWDELEAALLDNQTARGFRGIAAVRSLRRAEGEAWWSVSPPLVNEPYVVSRILRMFHRRIFRAARAQVGERLLDFLQALRDDANLTFHFERMAGERDIDHATYGSIAYLQRWTTRLRLGLRDLRGTPRIVLTYNLSYDRSESDPGAPDLSRLGQRSRLAHVASQLQKQGTAGSAALEELCWRTSRAIAATEDEAGGLVSDLLEFVREHLPQSSSNQREKLAYDVKSEINQLRQVSVAYGAVLVTAWARVLDWQLLGEPESGDDVWRACGGVRTALRERSVGDVVEDDEDPYFTMFRRRRHIYPIERLLRQAVSEIGGDGQKAWPISATHGGWPAVVLDDDTRHLFPRPMDADLALDSAGADRAPPYRSVGVRRRGDRAELVMSTLPSTELLRALASETTGLVERSREGHRFVVSGWVANTQDGFDLVAGTPTPDRQFAQHLRAAFGAMRAAESVLAPDLAASGAMRDHVVVPMSHVRKHGRVLASFAALHEAAKAGRAFTPTEEAAARDLLRPTASARAAAVGAMDGDDLSRWAAPYVLLVAELVAGVAHGARPRNLGAFELAGGDSVHGPECLSRSLLLAPRIEHAGQLVGVFAIFGSADVTSGLWSAFGSESPERRQVESVLGIELNEVGPAPDPFVPARDLRMVVGPTRIRWLNEKMEVGKNDTIFKSAMLLAEAKQTGAATTLMTKNSGQQANLLRKLFLERVFVPASRQDPMLGRRLVDAYGLKVAADDLAAIAKAIIEPSGDAPGHYRLAIPGEFVAIESTSS